uniref:Uncharacterized protein n=1 Tax=Picea glauca TaxID=3330 RepID=A0A101LW57_PICGL|nr:hypothetical protein ABT39_MTgene1570 [Picea glauca]
MSQRRHSIPIPSIPIPSIPIPYSRLVLPRPYCIDSAACLFSYMCYHYIEKGRLLTRKLDSRLQLTRSRELC